MSRLRGKAHEQRCLRATALGNIKHLGGVCANAEWIEIWVRNDKTGRVALKGSERGTAGEIEMGCVSFGPHLQIKSLEEALHKARFEGW